jgi:hypothetical protein
MVVMVSQAPGNADGTRVLLSGGHAVNVDGIAPIQMIAQINGALK